MSIVSPSRREHIFSWGKRMKAAPAALVAVALVAGVVASCSDATREVVAAPAAPASDPGAPARPKSPIARQDDRQLAAHLPGLAYLEAELRYRRDESCLLAQSQFKPESVQENSTLAEQVDVMRRAWQSTCSVMTQALTELEPEFTQARASYQLPAASFSFLVFLEDSEEEVGSFHRAVEVGPFRTLERCTSHEEEARQEQLPTRRCGPLSPIARLTSSGSG